MSDDTCKVRHARWGTGLRELHYEGHYAMVITTRNGAAQVRLECSTCGSRSGPLPRDKWVEAITSAADGVRLKDNSVGVTYAECVVSGCEERGLEHHHFAPVNTFGWDEANRWPVLPLCPTHHRHWHRTMDGYRWHARGVDVA